MISLPAVTASHCAGYRESAMSSESPSAAAAACEDYAPSSCTDAQKIASAGRRLRAAPDSKHRQHRCSGDTASLASLSSCKYQCSIWCRSWRTVHLPAGHECGAAGCQCSSQTPSSNLSRCSIQMLSQVAHLSQQSLCLSVLAGSACEVGKVALVSSVSLWLQISAFRLVAFPAGLPLFGSASFDYLLLVFG